MGPADEKLVRQAASARMVHMNEQIIFPLLIRNIEQKIAELCTEFKTKGTVSLSSVAYITACRDIKEELDATIRNGDRAYAKLNNQPD